MTCVLVRRHQFLLPARLVELPDGTVTPRYTFVHGLSLEVAYTRIPAMRRAEIHRRIGTRGEAVYRDRTGEIAAELAMHFEQARDWPRPAKYLLTAAENVAHRFAHHEAAILARRGLDVLMVLPDAPDRDRQILAVRALLAASLAALDNVAGCGSVEPGRL